MTYALLSGLAIDFKNVHLTFQDIAKKNNISITAVELYADSFLRVPRITLPENIGIDEIHSNMAKYGGSFLCTMVDNQKRCLFEILPDRSKRTLSRYLSAIPLEERKRVKFVTMDMWEPYKDCSKLYFPNCEIAVDPFHVIKHLNDAFDKFRISIQNQLVYNSPAYHLLKKWNGLFNDDIDLDNEPRYNHYFKQKMNYI